MVGVGSVGLRAYVALCEGSSGDDVVFLQLKQARRSVIAKHQHGAQAWHRHQGQRVVEYQQALQTVSDPLLGWTTFGDHQFYVRQFRDMKGAILIEDINAGALADYAGICGFLLAKSLPVVIIRHIVEFLTALGVAVYSTLICIQVFYRYFLNSSLAWSEEIVQFLLLWTVMLGSAMATDKGLHITLNPLEAYFGERGRRALGRIGLLGTVAF